MFLYSNLVFLLIDGVFVALPDDVGGLEGLVVVAQISKDRVIINAIENAIFEIFVVSIMLFVLISNPLLYSALLLT